MMAPPVDDCEPIETSSLFESIYEMDTDAEMVKKHISTEMDIFNLTYDIDRK